jgi:hypothetical protein
MREFIFSVFFIILISSYSDNLYPQSTAMGQQELAFADFSNNITNLKVKIFPVSMVMNGLSQYSLIAKKQLDELNNPTQFHYINCVAIENGTPLWVFDIPNNPASFIGFNYDGEPSVGFTSNASSDATFGAGIYKIIFYTDIFWTTVAFDTVYYEVDASSQKDVKFGYVDDIRDYGVSGSEPIPGIIFASGLHIPGPGVTWGPWWATQLVDDYVTSWDPYDHDPNYPWDEKDFGDAIYDEGVSPRFNPYQTLPLDPRIHANILDPNSDQNHFFPEPLFSFPNLEPTSYEDYRGNLSLNLIIKKDVNTPITLWSKQDPNTGSTYTSKPADINIKSGATLTIDKGNPNSQDQNILTLLPFTSINDGTDIIVNGPTSEYGPAHLILKPSDFHNEDAQIVANNYCNIRLKTGSETRIGKYANLIARGDNLTIGGKMYMEENSNIYFEELAEIIIESGGTIYDCGPIFTNNNNSCIRVDPGGHTVMGGCDAPITRVIDNGAIIFLNGGTLSLSDNTTLIFDGPNSRLKITSGSTINLGQNAKIEFKNGAYIDADDGTFSCTNGTWDGLYFENAGDGSHTSTIKNCTFNDAKIPIKIKNTSSSTANNNIVIQNNEINVPYSGSYGIYADNVTNILIQDNVFDDDDNNPKPSIYIKNPENVGVGDGLPGGNPVYSMNLIHNTFNNTGHGMILAGYTSALVQYYISNNQGSVKGYGLIGRRIDGDIKDNNISSSGNRNFLLHQSSPNLYDNVITSTHASGTGLALLSESSPKLAPVVDQGDFVWVAGNNNIEGNTFSVQFNYINSILLNYGQNVFEIASGSTNKHLYGPYNNATTILKASNNCWEPNGIQYNVWGTVGPVYVNTTNTSGYACRVITPTGTIVTDMGNGIFDTTYIAQNDLIETSGDDELVYGAGVTDMEDTSYYEAIAAFKGLIVDYPSSELTMTVLPDLYYCHEALDTFTVQADRNVHYGALKTFLEDRIGSGLHDSKFDEDAYNYILMCLGNMGEFDGAVSGYEFLSLYHPDPESRLMASEDLAIVEDLLEGEGGGMNNLTIEQNTQKIKRKVDRLISGDPIMSKVKKSYDKIREQNTQNLEKDLRSKYGREKADVKLSKIKQIDERFDRRVRENLSIMRNFTSEEKEQRHLETIMIIAGTDRNEVTSDSPDNTNPYKYTLGQNYPNPFNPTTTISYSIPNDLIVKIKIYDIAGREISALVNELKASGNHSVSFNGSNLASGVYFYKIEAGSFIETKRMVLVK